jgi:hypothetical protein
VREQAWDESLLFKLFEAKAVIHAKYRANFRARYYANSLFNTIQNIGLLGDAYDSYHADYLHRHRRQYRQDVDNRLTAPNHFSSLGQQPGLNRSQIF